jgi:hypothetical protein
VIHIQIRDTETDCYAFNYSVIEEEIEAGGEPSASYTDVVDFYIPFWGDPLQIKIEAQKLDDADDKACRRGGERGDGSSLPAWQIRILPEGWDISFSGAFTADGLTDPVYGLVPGSFQIDPAPGAPKTRGNFVTRFPDLEDRERLGAAAMAHVIHTDPKRFTRWDISLVPVSFGFGVGEASQARYFLGSGIRFGQKFFLTGGVVAGSEKRLPAGVSTDPEDRSSFTTDVNLLNNLPSRTSGSWFVGVSYTFAGVGPSAFMGPFSSVAPPPQKGQPESNKQTPATNNSARGAVRLAANITKSLQGRVLEYKAAISNTTANSVSDAVFRHKVHPSAEKTEFRCEATEGIQCPADGAGDIDVKLSLPAESTITFFFATTFANDQPEKKKLDFELSHEKLPNQKVTADLTLP